MRGIAIDKEGFTIINIRSRGTRIGIGFLFAVLFLFLPASGAYATDLICTDCHVSLHNGTTCPTCTTCHTGGGDPSAPQVAPGIDHHSGTCTDCHSSLHPSPSVPGPCSLCHYIEATSPINHHSGTGTPATCETCHEVAGSTYPGVIPNPLSAPCIQCHGGGTNPQQNPPRTNIPWESNATLVARANGIHLITPDLGVSALLVTNDAARTVTTTTATPGMTVYISDITVNIGGTSSNPSTTAFYVSTTTNLSGSTWKFSCADSIPALASGASSSLTTSTCTVPSGMTLPGTYYIVANADDGNTSGETNKANNTRAFGPVSVAANNVDLVISATSYAPNSAKRGTSINVTDVVINLLSGTAGASRTGIYLETSCVTNPTHLLGSRAIASIAGGGSNSGTTSVTIPLTAATGASYIIFYADYQNTVAETNETNNTRCRAITITN